MNLKDLLRPWVQQELPAIEISGLQNDSRQIKPGDLFLAYPGTTTDGRLFIEQALAAGAVAVLYEPEQARLPKTVSKACIPFADLGNHLSLLASRFYANPAENIQVVGVTGTNGKTTIAYQLAQAHQLLGEDSAYIGTIGEGRVGYLHNQTMTTPDPLHIMYLLDQYKKNNIQHLCMEVSSHALAQHRVDGVRFSQAIFSNLTHDHLDYHLTMEAYVAAKARLFSFEGLEYALLNRDDPYHEHILAVVPPKVRTLLYGLQPGADIWGLQWQSSMAGSQLEVQSPWGRHSLQFKALGQFNLYNTLAVWGSLLASGYEPEKLLPVMAQLQPAPGRMEIVAQSPCVVVDYAHTPDALEKALTTLQAIKKGQLWVVFGCGGDRDKTKRPIMGAMANQYADKVVITSDNPRTEVPEEIMLAIAKGLAPPKITAQLVNRKEAILYALERAGEKDIVLIAGKGHETYQEIGKIKYPFSDQDIVHQALQ